MASVFAASTAVLNRSLKDVDFLVLMTYHGLFGFLASLLLLTINCFIVNPDTATLRTLDCNGFDLLMLTAGASIDALSVFGQTVAFQSSPGGFVSLISFVSILYALAVDTFLFDEQIQTVEIGAAFVILSVTVCVAIYKLKQPNC